MEAMVSRTDLVLDFRLATSSLILEGEILHLQIDDSASNYIIPSLQLDDGWFMFSSLSKILSSITPNDMPLSEIGIRAGG
jgi:hypothetical protein